MTIGQRFLLTIIIVLVILFALAAFGFLSGRWSDEAQGAPTETRPRLQHTCITDDLARERLRAMMFAAIDEAISEQFKKLFVIWMADDRGQPERARVGVSQTLRAGQLVRQFATEWMPPLCEQEQRQ